MTTAFIHGCGVQWKVNVPGLLKSKLQLSPGFNNPESNDPSSAIALCGNEPLFFQVTLSPALTVIVTGSKVQESAPGFGSVICTEKVDGVGTTATGVAVGAGVATVVAWDVATGVAVAVGTEVGVDVAVGFGVGIAGAIGFETTDAPEKVVPSNIVKSNWNWATFAGTGLRGSANRATMINGPSLPPCGIGLS